MRGLPARMLGGVSPDRMLGGVSPARMLGDLSPARMLGGILPTRMLGGILGCPHSAKVRCAGAKVRMCSSTFTQHLQICTWCPRTAQSMIVRMCEVRRCLDLHRVEFGLCSSTFALCALAMFGSRVWCSSTFALSHQHIAKVRCAGTP